MQILLNLKDCPGPGNSCKTRTTPDGQYLTKLLRNYQLTLTRLTWALFDILMSTKSKLPGGTKLTHWKHKMHTTLQASEKCLHAFFSVRLSSKMVEKRAVEEVLIQPEKRNFQRPSPTKPSIFALRRLMASKSISTEKPHHVQTLELTISTNRQVPTKL